MLKCKREVEDDFANRIVKLEEKIRVLIDSNENIEKAKMARDKLEIIQAVNPNNSKYPVWPFRTTIVFTIFSPQILSIAGFALSVYETLKP